MKKIISLCLASQLWMFPCSLLAHDHHDHEEFQWTEEKSSFADIQMEIAGPGAIQNYTLVSGRVLVHPDYLGYAIPKASGTVHEIRKNRGDSVVKGEVLAVIESQEIAEAKSAYIRAVKISTLQKEFLEKERLLRGISAGQDYLNAELAYEEASLELESAKQRLYAIGFTDEEIGNTLKENPSARRFYTIKSPIAGKIVQRNLTLGELVGETTQAFTVANFEKVWIEMNVAQDDVRFLKEGLPVEFSCASTGRRAVASICQFDPTIREETRKATAVAVIENSAEQWVPGQYVSARIQTESAPASIVVAKEAVQKMDGVNYVFVVAECGSVSPCPVILGKTDYSQVEVVSGMKAGDVYVSTNAFSLKAEYQKEEGEHSH